MSNQEEEYVSESKSNSRDYQASAELMKVREQTPRTTDRIKRRADIIGLDLKPDPPSFGVLCAGHTFRLCITIMNVGRNPDRFRVSCEPHLMNENKMKCAYSPIRLAPGMKTSIVVTCFAMVTGHIECLVKIQSVSAKKEIHRRIVGTVIPEEQYKIIARNLRASGKSVYSEAVSGVDADLNSKEFLAEWKLSPDDVLELSRMPVVQGVYYNPVEKELVTDQGLFNVIVDSRGSLEKSIEDTERCWYRREASLPNLL
jgi:hypothetical protein